MLLGEIKADEQNNQSNYNQGEGQTIATKKSIDRLLRLINFSVKPSETKILQQRLRKIGKNPTLSNIKKHLIRFLHEPLNDIPQPELSIILRSGDGERLDLFK